MKKNFIGLSVTMLVLLSFCISCKEKKESTDIIIKKPVQEQVKTGTQKMEDSSSSTVIDWVGSNYTVDVVRTADTSLPSVEDGTGAKYYDNSVQVKISRKDGSEFFNRTFTKKDFDAYLDKSYATNSVLQAIVCLKAEGDNVDFSVSVGSPDVTSDEYMLLKMQVSRMGAVSISKETTDSATEDDEYIGDEELVED